MIKDYKNLTINEIIIIVESKKSEQRTKLDNTIHKIIKKKLGRNMTRKLIIIELDKVPQKVALDRATGYIASRNIRSKNTTDYMHSKHSKSPINRACYHI